MSKIQKIGELVQNHLSQPQITSPRFRLNLSSRNIRGFLSVFYEQEVKARGASFKVSDELTQVIVNSTRQLTADNGKLGIIYCGMCGNGKTTILRAISAMIDHLCEMGWCNETMPILSARKIAELSSDNVRFSNICNLPLLGIDDLGTEASEVVVYGNIKKPLTELLEYRYDRQLYTIITTNLPPSEISKVYGERVADRFRETIVPIVFTNKSYRQ